MVGASGSQQILTASGWRSLKSLYNAYVSGGINMSIAYVEPTSFGTVKYMTIRQVFNHSICSGIRLTSEDGSTCIVSAGGLILDMAEDYPPRPVARHPGDAKCLVGPNIGTSGKYLIRRIDNREFVTINCYSLSVPNMIGKGGFVIIE